MNRAELITLITRALDDDDRIASYEASEDDVDVDTCDGGRLVITVESA